MRILGRLCAAVPVVLSVSVFGAATVIIFDSLSGPVDDWDAVWNYGPLYASFSTGSTAINLTDVKLKLVGGNGIPDTVSPPGTSLSSRATHRTRRTAPGGAASMQMKARPQAGASGPSITVGLYADSGTRPGSLLATIGTVNDSALTSSPMNIDLPLATPYTLATNKRYWIGLSTTDSLASWTYTPSSTGTGVANEYYVWSGTVYSNSTDEPYQMQVSGTPTGSAPVVPLPPSVILALTGLAGVGLYFAGRRLVSSH